MEWRKGISGAWPAGGGGFTATDCSTQDTYSLETSPFDRMGSGVPASLRQPINTLVPAGLEFGPGLSKVRATGMSYSASSSTTTVR